jgi:hypothetical protein
MTHEEKSLKGCNQVLMASGDDSVPTEDPRLKEALVSEVLELQSTLDGIMFVQNSRQS